MNLQRLACTLFMITTMALAGCGGGGGGGGGPMTVNQMETPTPTPETPTPDAMSPMDADDRNANTRDSSNARIARRSGSSKCRLYPVFGSLSPTQEVAMDNIVHSDG